MFPLFRLLAPTLASVLHNLDTAGHAKAPLKRIGLTTMVVALLLALPAAGADWYVSPQGAGKKNGTSPANAADMFALNGWSSDAGDYGRNSDGSLYGPYVVPKRTLSGVRPGDTIWLLDGHYFVPERRNASGVAGPGHRLLKPYYHGTSDRWITIRARNPWKAVIDGVIDTGHPTTTGGSTFVVIRDLLIVNTDPQRVIPFGDYERPSPASTGGVIKWRNNIIANQGSSGGISFLQVRKDAAAHAGLPDSALDTELYGNIIYGSGVYQTNGTSYALPNTWVRGGGAYNQNDAGSRTIKHNISFANNTTGMKVFGVNGPVLNTAFIENTFFYCGSLGVDGSGTGIGGRMEELLFVGTDNSVPENITIDGNLLWNWDIDTQGIGIVLQWQRPGKNYRVVNNEMYHGRSAFGGFSTDGIIITNNTTFLSGGEFQHRDLRRSTATNPKNFMDHNQYYGWSKQNGIDFGRQGFFYESPEGGSYINYSFSNWRTALADVGWDANSTHSPLAPTFKRVTVHTNAYEPGRRDIIIRNFTGLPTHVLDLKSIGLDGREIEVYDAQAIIKRDGNSYALNPLGTLDGLIRVGDLLTLPLLNTKYVPVEMDAYTRNNFNKIAEHTNVRNPGQFNVFTIKAKPIVLQAEAEALPRSGNFTQLADSSASGGSYLRADGGGQFSFPVNIPASGTYYVHARIKAAAGTENSFFVRFNDGPEDVFDTEISAAWTWDRVNGRGGTSTERTIDPRKFNLTAGSHTLHFRGRETGAAIDRIVVSSLSDLDTASLPAPPEPQVPQTEPEPEPEPEPVDAILQAEAEALPRSGNFTQLADSSASGGSYLRADGGGQFSFPINIPASGDYYVHARIKAADGTENSFFVRFNDGPEDVFDTEIGTAWTWDKVNGREGTSNERTIDPRKFNLTAGSHTLHFRSRETGASIDRIAVSTNPNLDTTSLPAPPEPEIPQIEPKAEPGDAVLQAEAEVLPRSGNFSQLADPQASGGSYLRADGGAQFSFPVNIPTSGDYYVHARIKAADGTENSFFVRFNDGPEDVFDTEISTSWTWDKVNGREGTSSERTIDPRKFALTAGSHTLHFRSRETGAAVDRIAISSDPNLDPATLPAPPTEVDPASGEHVILLAEAENLLQEGVFTQLSDSLSSGGAYLRVDGGGQLGFPMELPVSGEYHVWARIKAASGKENSFFVRFDDGPEDVFDTEVSSSWTWDRVNGRDGTSTERTIDPRMFTLAAGVHTLRFGNRETGITIDSILVTSDPDFVPVGINALGPTPSTQAFATSAAPREPAPQTTPNLNEPLLTSVRIDPTAGLLHLEWSSRPNASYNILSKDSFEIEGWKVLARSIPGTGEPIVWSRPLDRSAPLGVFQIEEVTDAATTMDPSPSVRVR